MRARRALACQLGGWRKRALCGTHQHMHARALCTKGGYAALEPATVVSLTVPGVACATPNARASIRQVQKACAGSLKGLRRLAHRIRRGRCCLAVCMLALQELGGQMRPDLRGDRQAHARRSGRRKRPGWARSRRWRSGFEAGWRTALVERIEFSKLGCWCFRQSAAGSTRTCETRSKRARVSSIPTGDAACTPRTPTRKVRGGGAPLSTTALLRRRLRASTSLSQMLDAPRPAR